MVGRMLGGYRLEEQIGEGAFGKVYRALHVDMGWTGAVKVAREARFGTLLRDEGKLLARLKHPNIVSILHMETGGETPFVVMEYVDGESLAARLKRGPLTADETIELATRLLDGLAAAHELDILHRDIKPSNILIAADGTPKLADFGLGRVVAEESLRKSGASVAAATFMRRSQMSQSGSDGADIVGTIAYMSPEQTNGQSIDARSDIYSLGVVLYEAVTGKLPVGRFKLPGELFAGVPEQLDTLLDALLAPEPADRPESAAAAMELLRSAAEPSVTTSPAAPQKSDESSRPAAPPESAEERWADAEAYSARMRLSGRPDAEIADGLRRAGWRQEQVDRLLGEGQGLSGTWSPAAGSRVGQQTVGPHGGAMVWVPSGSFPMGSDTGPADEQPVHQVDLGAFWMGMVPVTVGEWRSVMGDVPDGASHDDEHPVVCVSWTEAGAFCHRTGLELPTEAQWEYAARGPESRVYPWGNQWDAKKCCNDENRGPGGQTFPAGHLPMGGSWCGGLDMAGNVWEWCADWYDEDYYSYSWRENPLGPRSGTHRVVRGGSWNCTEKSCRCARRSYAPDGPWSSCGFRVSATPAED